MKVLIVSGGEKPSKELLKKVTKDCNLIIGVDHGCDVLAEQGIIPSYIVGDFDSADDNNVKYLEERGSIKIKYNSEKDFTDSEIALNLAINEGATEIIFLGVTGTRLDHTFGNIGLILKALEKNINATIVNENNKILLLNKNSSLKQDKYYKYISFLAYRDTVENFFIKGTKYNLDDYTLKVGDSRTVSNEFLDEDIYVSFNEGILLVIYSKD